MRLLGGEGESGGGWGAEDLANALSLKKTPEVAKSWTRVSHAEQAVAADG